jgi:dihydropteroate synthase
MTPTAALASATRAIADGASMLDIGGESTRPGAARVDEPEQIARVVPAIRLIRAAHPDVPISVDSTRVSVAAAALEAGADAVNDVSAGEEDSGMLALVASRGAGIILMHRLTAPEHDFYSDQYSAEPRYTSHQLDASGGVVDAVHQYLASRLEAARSAGIQPGSIVLDPGLGFGKTVVQNMELIRGTALLRALGRPVLSGLSRKSFVGRLGLGRDSVPAERLAPTLALSVVHCLAGARLFRVHDVREHVEALNAVAGG